MASKKRIIEFDILEWIRVLRTYKRHLLITMAISVILAIIVAFSIPRIYKSSVMLAPESSGSDLMSSVSSLASMVGLYGDVNPTGEAIYPEIYPDLMQSAKFMTSLFGTKVTPKDSVHAMTYYDYMDKGQKAPFWTYPMSLISALLKNEPEDEGSANIVNPKHLTKRQSDIMKSMMKSIDCSVDKKTSVITITVTDQDPEIAANIADSVKERLQLAITDYRTNKARNDLTYMQKLFDDSKKEYENATRKYARYADSHQEMVLQEYQTELEELENDMQLKYNIYTQMVTQLQYAQAKLQEKTPAFTEIQEAGVPLRHSNSPKILILLEFLFLFEAIHVSIITFKHRKEIFVPKE